MGKPKKTTVNEPVPQKTKSERQEFAENFAKNLAQQTIHDPDGKTSRRKSRSFQTVTRESVEGYLESPTANEKNLRDASILLYQTSSRYRNLIRYYANIPKWYYIITSLNYNREKTKENTFKSQYLKVCNLLDSMCIAKNMREVMLIALREGAYYGVIWGGDGNSFILQKLNPDNCQIVKITDGNVFQFTYDMSKISEADLPTYYPPQFTDMYNAYRQGGSQYQLVPPEISFCIKGDSSIPEYSIPPFSAVLPGTFSLKNIEDLTETATELSNYKLLAGVIPVDSEGVPLIEWPVAQQYYSHIANNVGDRVGVAISPFKLESYDFEQSGNTAQIDNIARANENFFASAGTSALLHGATNSTSGVTKLAIKVDEAYAFELMSQCEAAINRYLKTLGGSIKFKISFLPVSIFNEAEMVDMYKSAMNYGMCKLQYAVCTGASQADLLSQAYIESSILDMDNLFTPMKTAATRSANESSENVGRPLSDDLSEEGEKTQDTSANDNK